MANEPTRRRRMAFGGEEARLEREIARKRRMLAALRAASGGEPARRAAHAAAGKYRFSRGSYLSYLYATVRETVAFGMWERILMLTRRVRFVSVFMSVSGAILAILRTGTLFILLSGILLAALPFIAAAAAIGIVAAVLTRRRTSARVKRLVGQKPLTVIFLSRDGARSVCIAATANELAAGGRAVLLVTPLLSRKPRTSPGVMSVSRPIYFYLDRISLGKTDRNGRCDIYI